MGAIAEALGLASALFSALPPVARRVGPRACLQAHTPLFASPRCTVRKPLHLAGDIRRHKIIVQVH